jgi:hypothetical protein
MVNQEMKKSRVVFVAVGMDNKFSPETVITPFISNG